ncbi:MAG: GntR family transcriptional regulator [Anaerolineae bacterium]
MNNITTSAPVYVQIAQSLRHRITSGELKPGDRLPAERNLSQHLGVTRRTLRHALQVLESEGLIVRRHGVGSFVSEPKIERRAERLSSFTTVMTRRGLHPGARIITCEQQPAHAEIAHQLDILVSTPVTYVRRLRLLNREPMMIEEVWMAVRRFPGLEQHDLEGRSLYEIMETEYGVAMARARRTLEPVAATKEEAQLLGTRVGAPLMLERRLGYSQDGEPVEYGKDRYRGDRFRFTAEDVRWVP